MPFIAGAMNDVFVSYAHADNQGDRPEEKWVSDFVKRLDRGLWQRLGTQAKIYFDTRSLESGQYLGELLDNAKSSALFVVILSPSYVAGKWTKDELDAFRAATSADDNIFAIEIVPLDDNPDAYPEPFRDRLRTQFYRKRETGSPETLTADRETQREEYLDRLTDVVEHMTRRLRAMHGAPPAPPPSPEHGKKDAEGGKGTVVVGDEPCPVLLAQVTDDLEEERNKVRRHLEQFKVTVLPVRDYPQGGQQFADAFRADLGHAGLFVQLLGRAAGRMPPDMPTGYPQFQYETAKAIGVRTVLWREPGLDPATITGPHAALLGNPEVNAMSLEAFKAEVVRRATQPPPKAGPEHKRSSTEMFFINADPPDIELAKSLKAEFARQGCAVALPAKKGTPQEVMEDFKANILECSAVFLIYGSVAHTWVRGQMRLINKLRPEREDPDCVVIVCNAPPEPKEPIDFTIPESFEIDYASVLKSQPLELLSKMRH